MICQQTSHVNTAPIEKKSTKNQQSIASSVVGLIAEICRTQCKFPYTRRQNKLWQTKRHWKKSKSALTPAIINVVATVSAHLKHRRTANCSRRTLNAVSIAEKLACPFGTGKGGNNMEYWLVCKIRNSKWHFVCGTDAFGYPMETTNRAEAWKFYSLETAWSYLSLGYCISKQYV